MALALPPLNDLPAQHGAQIHMSWDARDQSGKPVAPGVYIADLLYPQSIPYQTDSHRAVERVPAKTAASITVGQYYREPIFIGAPGAGYPQDPQINALASQMRITLYVPDQVPGSPGVSSASTFALPPVPGAPPSSALPALIHYGSELVEFIETAPEPLSRVSNGEPGARSFEIHVGGIGSIPAVVFHGVVGWSDADLDAGGLFVSLQGTESESTMIAVAKTLSPVSPVDLAPTGPTR